MDNPVNAETQAKLLADKRESEFNHHLAGLLVLAAGIFHYRGGKYSGAPVPRPASLAALFSSFRVIRSDFQRYGTLAVPSQSWYFGLTHHAEVLQHKAFAVITARTGSY